ncbi:MAG: NAD-dependent epimerase/dehydratase family protein [Chloroflexota bacterium]
MLSQPEKLVVTDIFQCDILDLQALEQVFLDYQPTIIIHLAAKTDLLGETIKDYRANVDGVLNLVEAIKKTPSVERCIFTSSQLVCRPGYVPQHDLDFQPINLYGQSKVLTEKIVREHNGANVVWCLTRPQPFGARV